METFLDKIFLQNRYKSEINAFVIKDEWIENEK